MLEEALAIWENRAGLGKDIAFDPEHAALLLRMGRVESVLDLSASGNAIPPPQQDRVRTLLAAAYLSGADPVVARNLKSALDEFRGLYAALREANPRLADEQARCREQAQLLGQQGQRELFLDLLDLRDLSG